MSKEEYIEMIRYCLNEMEQEDYGDGNHSIKYWEEIVAEIAAFREGNGKLL